MVIEIVLLYGIEGIVVDLRKDLLLPNRVPGSESSNSLAIVF